MVSKARQGDQPRVDLQSRNGLLVNPNSATKKPSLVNMTRKALKGDPNALKLFNKLHPNAQAALKRAVLGSTQEVQANAEDQTTGQTQGGQNDRTENQNEYAELRQNQQEQEVKAKAAEDSSSVESQVAVSKKEKTTAKKAPFKDTLGEYVTDDYQEQSDTVHNYIKDDAEHDGESIYRSITDNGDGTFTVETETSHNGKKTREKFNSLEDAERYIETGERSQKQNRKKETVPSTDKTDDRQSLSVDTEELPVSQEGYVIAQNIEQVKNHLSKYKNKPIKNVDSGIIAQFGTKGINEMCDANNRRHSGNEGFSKEEHFSAVANIVDLYKKARLVETHPDKKVAPGEYTNVVSVKHFKSPFVLNGTKAIAHITVKESKMNGHRIYALKLEGLEKINEPAGTLEQSAKNLSQHVPTAGSYINSITPEQKNINDPVKNKEMSQMQETSNGIYGDRIAKEYEVTGLSSKKIFPDSQVIDYDGKKVLVSNHALDMNFDTVRGKRFVHPGTNSMNYTADRIEALIRGLKRAHRKNVERVDAVLSHIREKDIEVVPFRRSDGKYIYVRADYVKYFDKMYHNIDKTELKYEQAIEQQNAPILVYRDNELVGVVSLMSQMDSFDGIAQEVQSGRLKPKPIEKKDKQKKAANNKPVEQEENENNVSEEKITPSAKVLARVGEEHKYGLHEDDVHTISRIAQHGNELFYAYAGALYKIDDIETGESTELDREIAQDERRYKDAIEEAKGKQAEESEKKERESIGGYTDNMTPMQRGKVAKVLNKQHTFVVDGKEQRMSSAEYLQYANEQGFRLETATIKTEVKETEAEELRRKAAKQPKPYKEQTEYRLYSNDESDVSYLTLNKTEADYFAWLTEKKSKEAGQDAASKPQKQPKAKIEDFGDKIGGARKDMSYRIEREKTEKKTKNEKSDIPAWRKPFEIVQQENGKWQVKYDRGNRKTIYQYKNLARKEFDSKEEAENQMKFTAYSVMFGDSYQENESGAKEYYIYKRINDRKRYTLPMRFERRDDLLQYVVKHIDDLLETKTSYGEGDLLTPEIAEWQDARRGNAKDRLQGRDATAQMFQADFGFKGVQFGNWNNQDERQELMNAAYEALHDLADVLGLPPKIISLNGNLSLAFGARGHGLSGARAHYEPAYTIINLTKMKGAGSLAHEWLHALDHYLMFKAGVILNNRDDLGRLEGSASNWYKYASDEKSWVLKRANLDPKLKEAFSDLVQSLFYKKVVEKQDVNDAQNWVAQASKKIDDYLTKLRNYIAKEREFGSRKKPATEEQLRRFDELSKEFVKAEEEPVWDSSKQRFTTPTLDKIAVLVKEITGRGFAATDDRHKTLMYLRNMYHVKKRVLDDAQKNVEKSKNIPTEYSKNNTTIDTGRTTDYWTKPTEMLARAFSAMIEDNLHQKGQTSDFLSYGSDNRLVDFGKPFPEGDERKTINGNFKAFFKEVAKEVEKTKADTGEIKFSVISEIDRRNKDSTADIDRSFDEVLEEVKTAFPNAKSIEEQPDGTIRVVMPNGIAVKVDVLDRIIVNEKEEEKARQDHNASDSDIVVQGYWQKVSGRDIDGVLAISKESAKGTTYHESLHMAMDLALTPKEKKALTDYYAKKAKAEGINVEEAIADGYAAWRLARENGKGTLLGKLFKKMHDFWHNLRAVFTGIENAHNVMRRIESGEVWERDARTEVTTTNKPLYSAKQTFTASKNRIKHFVKSALEHPNEQLALRLGKVSKAERDAILSATGIDVEGYEHVWLSDDIRHARKRHGKNKEKREDQIGLSAEDMIEALSAIESPDKIKKGSVINNEPRIIFYKTVSDGEYTVVEVVKKGKRLIVKTMWKKRKEATTTTPPADKIDRQLNALDDNGKFASAQNTTRRGSAFKQSVAQDDESVKYSVRQTKEEKANSPSVEEVHEAATNNLFKKMFKWTKGKVTRKDNPNVKVEEGKGDQKGGIGLVEYMLASPSRIAEKHPAFKPLFQWAQNAMEKEVKLRSMADRKLSAAFKMVKSKEDTEALINILWEGDATEKEWTKEELLADGVKENVADAYITIRRLMTRFYKYINDARTGKQVISKTMSEADAKALEHNDFVTRIISQVKQEDGKVLVTYEAYRHWEKTHNNVTGDVLMRFKDDEAIQVLSVESVNVNDETLYNVKLRERVGDMHKRTGYIPHFFHNFFVIAKVKDEDGNIIDTVVGSARSQSDAVKQAEEYVEQQKKLGKEVEGMIVRPKQFDFAALGVDEHQLAATVGDREYAKMVKKLETEHDMTLDEAKEIVSSIAKTKGRHRFFGNALQRKGTEGYEKDMKWVLRHFTNSASRYVALETEFKPKAISMYERMFGAFDKDPTSLLAKYIKQYIGDLNGNPTQLEEAISRVIQKTPWLNKIVKDTFGDRYALYLAGQVTGWTSVLKLGFLNASSALLNLSQLINASVLINDNPAVSGMRLAKAMKRLTAGTSLSDRKVLVKTGVLEDIGLDSGSGYDKARPRSLKEFGKSAYGFARGLGDKSMYLFKKTEELVRRSTVLAAYEQARAEGKTDAEAIEFAKEVNRKANFDYGVQDAPNIFRRGSIISQIVLQFKKYGIKEMELMLEMTPLVGKNTNKKQKVAFWSMYILLCAGLWQTPLMGLIDDIISLVTLGKYQPTKEFKAYVYKKIDEDPESKPFWMAVMKGAPFAAGIDLSSRTGMADFFPSVNAHTLIGVSGSTAIRAIGSLWDGDGEAALRAISPSFANAYSAATGEKHGKRGRMMSKYEEMQDRLIRAAGFTSSEEAEEAERAVVERYVQSVLTREKQQAIDDLLEAQENGEDWRPYAKRLMELGVTGKTVEAERKRKKMTAKEIAEEKEKNKKKRKEKKDSLSDYAEK